MVIGGSALSKGLGLKPRWTSGIDIYAGYGMSETGPLISGRASQKPTTDGQPRRTGGNRTTRVARTASRSARRRSGYEGHRRRRRSGRSCAGALADAGLSVTIGARRSNCGRADTCIPTTSRTVDPAATSRSPIASRTSSRLAASGSARSKSRTSSAMSRSVSEVAVIGVKDENGENGPWRSSSATQGDETADEGKITDP